MSGIVFIISNMKCLQYHSVQLNYFPISQIRMGRSQSRSRSLSPVRRKRAKDRSKRKHKRSRSRERRKRSPSRDRDRSRRKSRWIKCSVFTSHRRFFAHSRSATIDCKQTNEFVILFTEVEADHAPMNATEGTDPDRIRQCHHLQNPKFLNEFMYPKPI